MNDELIELIDSTKDKLHELHDSVYEVARDFNKFRDIKWEEIGKLDYRFHSTLHSFDHNVEYAYHYIENAIHNLHTFIKDMVEK